MMLRYIYTVQQFIVHRKILQQYATDPQLQSPTILDIAPQQLYAAGIRTMVIDFDGVLTAHAMPVPDPMVEQWLAACVACFGREQVFILSNNPIKARQEYFAADKNRAQLFISRRKKPFPDSLHAISQQCGRNPSEIMVIDDRLATGILAAIIAGTKAIFITRPCVNFAAHPVREGFFMTLRKIEQFLCKC